MTATTPAWMSREMSNVPSVFNAQLLLLLGEIQRALPDNAHITMAITEIGKAKKINPMIPIRMWKNMVAVPYGDRIKAGDLDFFLEKDYSSDLASLNISGAQAQIFIDAIDDGIRGPMRSLLATHRDDFTNRLGILVRLADAF